MKNIIILIDLWNTAINDILNLNYEYTNSRLNNIINFLNKIKNNNSFDIYNANYASNQCIIDNCRCNKHIRKLYTEITKLNITFIDSININNYNNIYIIGLSLDGCVLKRDLGYLNINHKNKFIIKDCCLNENPIRGDLVNNYYNKNKNDFVKTDRCPDKWFYNYKIEWDGPYYYFKDLDAILKYENFIFKYYSIKYIEYKNIETIL